MADIDGTQNNNMWVHLLMNVLLPLEFTLRHYIKSAWLKYRIAPHTLRGIYTMDRRHRNPDEVNQADACGTAARKVNKCALRMFLSYHTRPTQGLARMRTNVTGIVHMFRPELNPTEAELDGAALPEESVEERPAVLPEEPETEPEAEPGVKDGVT